MHDRKAADSKYRENNREACNARSAAYKKAHPIKLKRSRKVYREENKESITVKAKKYRAKTVAERKAYMHSITRSTKRITSAD